MIKAVFLDIDNTLLDFDAYCEQAMRDGFAHFHLRPYEEWMFPIFNKINNGLWCDIENGDLTIQELRQVRWQKIFKALDIDFDGSIFEDFFKQALWTSAIPIKGAYELLDCLSIHYRLYAASNGPYAQQINRLKIAHMYDYFDDVFVSEHIGAQKPSQAFFDYCFKEIGDLKPEEILLIGDSLTSDMAGGHAAHMKTCLFDRHRRYHLPLNDVDMVIYDLNDIEDVLDNMTIK